MIFLYIYGSLVSILLPMAMAVLAIASRESRIEERYSSLEMLPIPASFD